MANKYDRSLSDLFDGHGYSDHGTLWDSCWTTDKTPWDRQQPSAALSDLLLNKPELFEFSTTKTTRTALVPGCGRGHDVLSLSTFGYDVYGLDLSATAIQGAKKNEEAWKAAGKLEAKKGILGNRAWFAGDFFSNEWVEKSGVPGGKFDLIFDYTFGCALPWEARPAWAKRIAELLALEGRLVCLEFPTTKPPSARGPPYNFTPEAYLAQLGHPGEKIYSNDTDAIVDDKWADSPPSKDGLKRLIHIKPERTHPAGMEGDVVEDWISVWAHNA
ncbi:hypothetical protein DL768_006623 [Monosporascus sp. mg162]|nr:hypothetical protein DL768_006623 [Monosporascus sp. mg162]